MASSSNPNILQDRKAVIEGSEFSYFDTGAPAGSASYETYLLIHGLCHNKRTWKDIVRTKPEFVRLVAFSLRGYNGSSPFKGDETLQDYEIGPILGSDFISIVTYVVEQLSVPYNKGSSFSIMAWSLGAASVVAGYGTLIPPVAPSDQKWTSYISKIVFYEPAGVRAFGLKNWTQPEPVAKRQKTELKSSSSQSNRIEGFARVVSSYYKYPEPFFSKPSPDGLPDRRDTFEIEGCLAENTEIWKECQDGIFESGPQPMYSRLRYNQAEEGANESECANAFVHDALTAMAKTEVKRIHGVSTKYTLPACVLAVKWLNAVVDRAAPGKFRLTWIPGRYNHYVHNTAPECLWEALEQGME